MGRKITLKTIILLGVLLCLPTGAWANYVRPNQFMDKKGAEKIIEIKRFQAQNNLEVTGGLNKKTQEFLYNPKFIVYDVIEKPPTKGNWIVVNKSRRILTMYRGNQSLGKYPVAVGKSSSLSPSYRGRILNKAISPAWKHIAGGSPANPLGQRWMGIYVGGKSGYGIHGTIKPHEIGTGASAGCIRMYNYDIETYVFPKMKVGDPVWIGTDEELASWGVRQIIDVAKGEPKPQEKPTPEEPKVEETNAVEVLKF